MAALGLPLGAFFRFRGAQIGEDAFLHLNCRLLTLKTLDPYQFPSTDWIDDVLLWPPVDFPSLYRFFIDAPGGYTRKKLKAYKSLEAYNYYQRFVALNCVQWYNHFDLSAVVGSKLSFITV